MKWHITSTIQGTGLVNVFSPRLNPLQKIWHHGKHHTHQKKKKSVWKSLLCKANKPNKTGVSKDSLYSYLATSYQDILYCNSVQSMLLASLSQGLWQLAAMVSKHVLVTVTGTGGKKSTGLCLHHLAFFSCLLVADCVKSANDLIGRQCCQLLGT